MSRVDDIIKKIKNTDSNDENEKTETRVDRIINKVKTSSYTPDSSVLSSFASDYEDFVKTASGDYDSVNYKNASYKSEEYKKRAWDLSSRINEILAQYNLNRQGLSEEEQNLKNYLTTASRNLGSIESTYRDTSRFYSQFANEREYNVWYDDYKKGQEYQSARDAEDFDYYSQAGANIKNPSAKDAEPKVILFGQPIGGQEVGNVVTYSIENKDALAFGEANGGGSYAGGKYLYSFMNEDEVSIYNYYLGKGETEKAAEYLNYLEDTLNKRMGGQVAENIDGTLLEAFHSGLAGIEQAAIGFRNIDNLIMGTEGEATTSTQYAQGIMSENNKGIWKVTNDLLNTTGNMLPSILVGSFTGGLGGAVTLGVSATGNAYSEMRKLGYDEWQSRGYAVLTGASETALSYFLGGISKLGGGSEGIFQTVASKIIPSLDNAIARVAIQVGGNMLDEGLEEAIQEVLDPVFKMVVTGEEFEGIDLGEVLYSGLLGALSAGMLEGVPTIAGNAISTYNTNVANGGLSIGEGIKATLKGDLKNAFNTGKQAVTESAGYYVNEALEIDSDNAHAQRMQARINKGKDVSGYQINRLVEANENTLVSQDKDKMKAAVESRLTELGERSDISKLSDIIVKAEAGEKLTRAETQALEKSDFGRSVSRELSTEALNSNQDMNRWAESLDTERINAEAYSRGVTTESKVARELKDMDAVTENATVKENAGEGEISAPTGKVKQPVAKATMVDNEGNNVEAKVAKIAEVENGEATLELEGGQTVKASDVDFGESGIGFVYNTATEMVSGVGGFNVDAANVMVRGFSPNGSVQAAVAYVSGFNEAYRYGAMGYPVSALATGNATSKIGVAQREAAYNLGKAYGEGKVAAKQAKIDSTVSINTGKDSQKATKKGKVYFDGSTVGKSLTERQKASLKGLRLVAEATGVDIHVFESKVVDGKRQGANGWYDPVKKEIHLDLHAGVDGNGLMLFTASHELTHFIRDISSAKFKIFADALLEEFTKNGKSIDALIEEKLEHLERNGRLEGKTEEEAYDLAYEEVVADAAESMLVDSNAIEALSKKLQAKDKGLWETIKDFITKLVNRIKAAYEGLNPDSDEGKLVREMKDSAERLQKLWVDALLDASEVGTSADVEAQADNSAKYMDRKVDNNAKKRYNKRLIRDDFATNAMIWAHSDKTAVGEQKLFYRKGQWVLLEKSDDGFVEISQYTAKQYDFISKEISRHNEELHDRGIDERIYRSALRYENLGSGNSRNNRNDVEQQASDGRVSTVHQRKYYSDRSRDNESGKYDIRRNAQELDNEYISAVNRGDTETAQEIVVKFADLISESWKKPQNSKPAQDNRYINYRNPDSYSNRSLLAGALETAVQNDIERQKLAQYKEKIDLINAEEQKLQALREQIKELSFKKGPRDTQAIKSLQFEANQAANRINTYDRQLLNLESTKALKGVLEREKEQARKRAEQKAKDALERQREKAAKTQRELMERYQESRKKATEGRNKTAMRHKIKDVVNELNTYLLKGTKDKHVPIELQKAVAEALDAVNMDTVGAEERIAKLKAELMRAKTPEAAQEIAKKIEHIEEMGGNMAKKISRLKTAYDSIINSDDPLIANSHDEVISSSIERVMGYVGETPLRDMSLPQLEAVYDMYRMVLHSIRAANKAFKAQKSEEISVIANRVMEEVDKLGKQKALQSKAGQVISEFDWNNQKPVYAFDRIGSDTFTEVFNNVRAGEDTWAQDMSEAQDFREKQYNKHKYSTWDFKKRYAFTSSSGMKFELTLPQIMSLYAYSKRDQAAEHLKRGGIVFDETTEVTVKNKLGIPVKFNPTKATAYNISEETLANIISKLSTEQKAFVDEMQEYLSSTMGEKGNEVSLELYGVKLFKEKNYFPLKSASQFMAKAKEQQKGEVKIKNSGFTKETVRKANNPIVLTPFMDVWAGHVNEMSMYHAFTLALEDFYRVYNYKTPTSETMATESVEMFLQNAHGKAATKYIDQLLKDLNGGARVDSTIGIINKLTGLFKKSAVFASASVVVQQPSAIARATALVDTKYFVGKPSKHKQTWAEVKKYAPVAVIKEMGYFDTGMGKSSTEWLKGEKTFMDKVDDVASKAPALADEYAWCAIWNAIKRETVHNNPKLKTNSEEFLKLVGERFTEVIVKTQVYDSVLSRSANMRSKDTGMKMATAFMGEPTTSLNMLQDALIQGKRGNKKYAAKAIGGVISSMILNSILVSIVYAGRDDDEEKTYTEKYISTLTEELLDSFNPLTLIPFVKDIVSIVQGYDVERSDMAVITDLINAWNNLDSDNRSVYRKIEDFGGAIASIFGLPVKNIMRDVRGMYNTVNSFISGEKTTGAGISNAIEESITGKEKSNGQQLYEAMLKGDTEQIERVKSRFEDEKAISTAIRKALRENDSRIKEAAEARYNGNITEYMKIAKAIIADGFKQDDVVAAINSEINALKKGEGETSASTTSDKAVSLYSIGDYYSAIMRGQSSAAYAVKEDLIQTDIANGKDRDEAEDSFNSKLTNHVRDMYEAGGINDYKAKEMLTNYAGKTEEEAASKVQYWSFKKKYPDYDLTESAVSKYYSDVEPSGISVDIYYEYSKLRAKAQGTDLNGDGKTDSGSVKKEVMQIINSLPISSYQKDALYFLNGWSQSTLWEAPWR